LDASAQIFNVKSSPYNAMGDGTTDDRMAILNAINAANTWSNAHSHAQATVYFPMPSGCSRISNRNP